MSDLTDDCHYSALWFIINFGPLTCGELYPSGVRLLCVAKRFCPYIFFLQQIETLATCEECANSWLLANFAFILDSGYLLRPVSQVLEASETLRPATSHPWLFLLDLFSLIPWLNWIMRRGNSDFSPTTAWWSRVEVRNPGNDRQPPLWAVFITKLQQITPTGPVS